MKHFTQPDFWQFNQVGHYWSVRVILNYRALAVEDNGDFVWFWIGTHGSYDGSIR